MTLLVLLVDNVGTLLVPTMLANMVNTGITTGDVDYILRNGLYMLIATGMASGGTVLGCYLSARLAANVACDIRNAVYDKSLELAASDFERFGTGSMITRSLNDINVIQQAILQTIQLVLPVPFLAVAGIIFAWFIDPAMGTLLGVVVAIVLVAAVFTVANAAPIFMRLQDFIDRMNVVLRENIVGVRVIRAFNKERHEERRLDEVYITANKNAIPNDPQSPFVTSGVRIGTPAVTTRGMGPDEMKVIADCIADCVFDFANKKDEVARKVEELTKKFPLYE